MREQYPYRKRNTYRIGPGSVPCNMKGIAF